MERNERDYHILIIYDIVQDKRRTKFAEFLNGYGYRIQKSCFEAVITKKMYKQILKEVPRYFDKGEDSIRIYLLGNGCSIIGFGVSAEVISERVGVL